MAESKKFGFVNVANFQVYVDSLAAFRRYLELGVDTVLGVKPQVTHISRFCVKTSYRGRPIPKNWQPDPEERGAYLEKTPAHYWLEASQEPLMVCTIGSGAEIDLDDVKRGRETFPEQRGLVKTVMDLVTAKDFNRDVLPHIPHDCFKGDGINEDLLQRVLQQRPVSFEGAGNAGGDFVVTGQDLRGCERIGYTIRQIFLRDAPLCHENALEIGLCKAYYPK
jgi:hypothetical protein